MLLPEHPRILLWTSRIKMNFKMSPPALSVLVRGLIAGFISPAIYFLIVVFTTPSLPPSASVIAAVKVNWVIIVGLSVGIGSQIYISSYGRILGCNIDNKKKCILSSSGTTVLSSFFSFFSLVPLGCCGSWLLILSLMPSVFGSTISVVLIQYARPLSYLGMLIVLGYSVFTSIKLKREIKKAKLVETERKYHRSDYL
jgi:hypothetical protein